VRARQARFSRSKLLPFNCRQQVTLNQALSGLGVKYGRYGYRRITVLLRNAGWPVGKDRVQRIWRREGLKVPQKQRPRECRVTERDILERTRALRAAITELRSLRSRRRRLQTQSGEWCRPRLRGSRPTSRLTRQCLDPQCPTRVCDSSASRSVMSDGNRSSRPSPRYS